MEGAYCISEGGAGVKGGERGEGSSLIGMEKANGLGDWARHEATSLSRILETVWRRRIILKEAGVS